MNKPSMITPTRLSYGVLAVTIILAGLLHLGAPLLVVLVFLLCIAPALFSHEKKVARC